MLALIAGVWFAGNLFGSFYGESQRTVQEDFVASYLEALKEGDVETAIEMIAPPLSEANSVLLTEEVYKNTKDKIESYKIAPTKENEILAEVTYAGKTEVWTFIIEPKSGAVYTYDAFKKTSIVIPEISALGQGKLIVNGVEITVDPTTPISVDIYTFPGTYKIDLPRDKNSLIVADSPSEFTTGNSGELQVEPTAKLEALVDEEISSTGGCSSTVCLAHLALVDDHDHEH